MLPPPSPIPPAGPSLSSLRAKIKENPEKGKVWRHCTFVQSYVLDLISVSHTNEEWQNQNLSIDLKDLDKALRPVLVAPNYSQPLMQQTLN